MADHVDLLAEIPHVEKMNTQDRLKHAKKRRLQQLKRWQTYEKHLEKESVKKQRKTSSSRDSQVVKPPKNIQVSFVSSVMLLEGSARNDLDEVRQLLEMGVSPDVSNEDGLTALHQCCIDDNESMLKLLIEYRANTNARDSEGWTPLHAAATCGHVHLCKILIDSDAELLAVNTDGNMPYDICEDDTTLDFVEIEMAKRGITQEEIDTTRDATEKQFLEDLRELAAKKGNLEYKDSVHGATPLHIAAANGYLEVGEFLLEKHVAVDARDEDSWQPIHAAACWCQPEMLELLVKYGANIDAKTRNGETPFDICEEPDLKQKILDLKDALETKEATRRKEIENLRRKSHSRRSASIRRSSMREKNLLSLKDVKDEAARFAVGLKVDDDEYSGTESRVPATNIDDIAFNSDINQNRSNHSPRPTKKNPIKDGAFERRDTQYKVGDGKLDENSNSNVDIDQVTVNLQSDCDIPIEVNRNSQTTDASRDDGNRGNKTTPGNVRTSKERRSITGRMKDVFPLENPERSGDSRSKYMVQSDEVGDTKETVQSHKTVHRIGEPPTTVERLDEESQVLNPKYATRGEDQQTCNTEGRTDTPKSDAVRPTPLARGPQVISSAQGTLADLKKQRSEKYNSGKSATPEASENPARENQGDVGRVAERPQAPTRPQKPLTKNGYNPESNGPSSPVAKFSAPHSSPVVGSVKKNECCTIL